MTENAPGTAVAVASKGPARGYSWPPFEPGNIAHLKHGAFSSRAVGERAGLVLQELAAQRPDLVADENALSLALLARATAREELAHEGLEAASAAGRDVSPRLLEAATAAARVARELADSLGIGPLAAAQLRQTRSSAALNVASLAQQAPLVLAAIQRALSVCGLAERAQDVVAALDAALMEVTEDD
ncbi:MAG: hypothetical protein ABSA65_14915 [Acidimicrobiales bacterium]|jgi:hypothetical protein